MKICPTCNKEFENHSLYANHIRWYHKDNANSIEKIKISSANYFNNKLGEIKTFEVICEKCNKKFNVNERVRQFPKREKYFCSRKCVNSHDVSNETRDKISKSIIEYIKIHGRLGNIIKKHTDEEILNFKLEYNENPICCIICDQPLQYEKRTNKTCSRVCQSKLNSISRKGFSHPNCGGQTNYYKYKYNDIWMDSTWEVELAKWLDENKIKWIRSRKINFKWIDEEGYSRIYYPDFYLPEMNLYLDPKNKYLVTKDLYKLNYVINNHKINLFFGELSEIKEKIKNYDNISVL